MATTDARFDRAGPADEALLLEMVREFYAHERLRFHPGRTDAALAALLADERFGRAWIARSGGAAAGYLLMTLGYSLEFGGRDAFVDELWIREPFRGAGLGKLAIASAEEACRELGVHALHLEVDRVNTGAQRLYRALGFHDHDRHLLTRWVGEAAPPFDPKARLADVISTLRDHREELMKEGVRAVSVFGSVARGEEDPGSDVDLLVDLSSDVSLFDFIGIKQRLEEILGTKVDLATKDMIRDRMRPGILREAISVEWDQAQ